MLGEPLWKAVDNTGSGSALGLASRMPRTPLPAELASGPFAAHDAINRGVPASRLRAKALHHITHGVHCATPVDDGPELRRALLLGLPEAVALSHLSAGDVHGFPRTARQTRDRRLHVMCGSNVGPIRREGVAGHRGLEQRVVHLHEEFAVVDAADTWCDYGELVRCDGLTVEDLVVVGDAAANVILRPDHTAYDFSDRRPQWWSDVTLDQRLDVRQVDVERVRGELRQRLDARNRPRGKVLLSQALPLIRPWVRSPQESRARLMFIEAGFPEPVVNLDIHDDDGQWLAEGDLVWPEHRLIGEYQGEHHASRHQASKDSDRRSRLRDRNWRTREIWAEDLSDPLRRHALLKRFAILLDHRWP